MDYQERPNIRFFFYWSLGYIKHTTWHITYHCYRFIPNKHRNSDKVFLCDSQRKGNCIFNNCLHSNIKCILGREFPCWQCVGDENEHPAYNWGLGTGSFLALCTSSLFPPTTQLLHVQAAKPRGPSSSLLCHQDRFTPFSVQSSQLSHVRLFVTPWNAACQASVSITNSQSLLKLMSIESVIPSSHLILCHPLLFLRWIFPASGSFQMSQFFTSGGQSIGASASVFPMNIRDWFPLGLTGLISLQSKGLSRVFSNTTVQKHQFFGAQLSL